jgi:hypothetical protein
MMRPRDAAAAGSPARSCDVERAGRDADTGVQRRLVLEGTAEVPDAADLVATARAAVLEALLPQLPPQAQYTARMVAHALGIVARELATPECAGDACAELVALAQAAGVSAAGDVSHDGVGIALAHAIRAGRYAAGPDRVRVHAALVAWTRARLGVTDPRAAQRMHDGMR